MNIRQCSDYAELSRLAAALVLETLAEKPDLLLCAATGSSPEGLYRELASLAAKEKEPFAQLKILKLDEWGGIPENHPVSCEYFLRTRLLNSLSISGDRYISFSSDPSDPGRECRRVRAILKAEGPIDLCILGLGANGHLALNEPAPALEPYAHMAVLSQASLRHPMIASLEPKPTYGLTLGMKEILDSRRIIMLVSGKGKQEVAGRFLEGKVSPQLPASFLWQHPQVECLVESAVLE